MKLSNTAGLSINPSRQVREAEIKDIAGIISVLEQNLIRNKPGHSADTLEQTGFLIKSFSPEEAKSAITDKKDFIFLVSTENDHVVGYAMGCHIKKLDPTFLEELSSASSEIKEIILSKKILYLRHIAKKINTIGVGKDLLQQLVNFSIEASYNYIICTIAEKPIQNTVSKRFHEKNNFVCAGFYQGIDKTFGVYFRKI